MSAQQWGYIEGISARFDDLSKLQCFIDGPADCPYTGSLLRVISEHLGGVFELEVLIPQNYPFQGPKCKFVTVIYHPWVNEYGTICFKGTVVPW
jgi:ubiquitin-protein ligase